MAENQGTPTTLPWPWRLVRFAGRGASASVWHAVGDGDVHVALKVFHEVEQQKREGDLLGLLGCRYGPALVARGTTPHGAEFAGGAPYLATRWVEGATLGDAWNTCDSRNRQRLAERVAFGVARSLDELHQAGVCHGDVKPANIVIDGERAALVDLGFGSYTGDVPRGATPRYASPEIVEGARLTPAADLWALGLVLGETLLPEMAQASDPRAYAGVVASLGDAGSVAAALLAHAPGARPGAGWVAEKAAGWLDVTVTPEEHGLARRARVRRAYLRVRAPDLRAGAGCALLEEPMRSWLRDAGLDAANPDLPQLASLDSFGLARWLVLLAGPSAARWPSFHEENSLAERLLGLCDVAPPEAWTYQDLTRQRAFESCSLPSDRRLRDVTLSRALRKPRPSEALLDLAEKEVLESGSPLGLDLASALLRRGETGRAFAVLQAASDPSIAAVLLRAEIERRRGERESARRLAQTVPEKSPDYDQARALLGRLAWESGDPETGEATVGDARGPLASEVRALVAYQRGDFEGGLREVDRALGDDPDGLDRARLEGMRGLLEHARGEALASLGAFERACDVAWHEGGVVEEATYLTGFAAAAVDAGKSAEAVSAATRAALLWERLGHQAMGARALLARAAAYAMVGAQHEADRAADIATDRARSAGDFRAVAFARWARVETRVAGDPLAREEATQAARELAASNEEDSLRAAARLLVWGEGRDFCGAQVDVARGDEQAARCSPPARWEWWGARALSSEPSSAVLRALVALAESPAPLSSRGPALAAGVGLASLLGDGETARRLELLRGEAARALRDGAPAEHQASVDRVAWAHHTSTQPSTTLAPAQVDALEAIVRSLSGRDRLKPLLSQVLDMMILWTGVERGVLLLRTPDGRLAPRIARNLARGDLTGDQLALSTTVARQALDERRPVTATDAFSAAIDLRASVHALGLRSILAVPLVARGDALGVVYLDDRVRRDAFGPNELAWVKLVASQAALAIADARDQVALRRAVRRASRASARLAAELDAKEEQLRAAHQSLSGAATKYRYDAIEGRSEATVTMLRMVDRVTASDVPILIVGESGTGKELVARAVHDNGPRSAKAFVSENCGSVPEPLLEATLFGHVRGAFTGATSTRAGLFDVADGGTLLLDEIGEMPMTMQTKLLRVLQDGELRPVGSERSHRVDVRIVGATHRDLAAMVSAGQFREDLFYRINVVSIRVPPLRERRGDIPLLVARFLAKHGSNRNLRVSRGAMSRLVAHSWPGNVRQLENEVRRAIVLADDRIDVGELSDEVALGATPTSGENTLRSHLDALEATLVRRALEQASGNQTRAASSLGVSRFGLQKMIKRLGLGGEVALAKPFRIA